MKRLAFLTVITPLLTACADAPEEDLRAWMAEIRKQAPALPAELPGMLSPDEFRYDAAGRPDPFAAEKIAASLGADPNASGIQPDMARVREPLEAFPLDSLRMIGSLRRHGQVVALVEADKVIHQVRLGSHLGSDMGKVIAISENTIEIEEMIQDTGDRWTRRRTQLAIRENR